MKTKISLMWVLTGIMAILQALPDAVHAQEQTGTVEYYYAVEMSGVVCGYARMEVTPPIQGKQAACTVDEDVMVKLSIMGQGTDIGFKTKYLLDPTCSNVTSIDRNITIGATTFQSTNKIENGQVAFYTSMTGEQKTIDIPDRGIIESPLGYKHLLADFIHDDTKEKTYPVLDDVRGNFEERKYTFKGEEDLDLGGKVYQALKFEELNTVSGTIVMIWINREDGLQLKVEVSGRTIRLADPSVTKQISIANADDLIFAKVGKVINNLQDITYMKVKGTIQTAGEIVTPESLNFPGQRYTGTVENNLIEGVFEIEPKRYDGTGAPPFPPDFNGEAELQQYLKPGELIESNDPLIVQEAAKITEGSADSWEAAVRLSKWVAEEIRGAIPGGTSAINTYKTREGECGSHSRLLAAFCRAVGIPARLSVGCMYSPYYGGSFGQHAWTEVWMGEAGWVAVDATAFEFDYVDAGHIRLGEKTTFNPKAMEILDYRISESETTAETGIPDKYLPYLGKYTLLQGEKTFTVLYSDNGLAVDIPGQMTLALNDPDEEGRWYPKLTRQINFTFPEDASGRVEKMVLQQLVPVNRSGDPEEISPGVPEEMRPFLGMYTLPAAQMNLDVIFEDGSLCVIDSRDTEHVKLGMQLENGRWPVLKNKDEIEFKPGVDGKIQSLIIYTNIDLVSGEPVAAVIEKIILDEGTDKGIAKYYELKELGSGDYLFAEESLNALGYKFLSKDKIDEAIAVFQLNAREYPESFNVYDSLGEAYWKKGEKNLAIENYEKSLLLNPENENGREMLKQIKAGK